MRFCETQGLDRDDLKKGGGRRERRKTQVDVEEKKQTSNWGGEVTKMAEKRWEKGGDKKGYNENKRKHKLREPGFIPGGKSTRGRFPAETGWICFLY